MYALVTLTILGICDHTPVEYVTVPYEWTGDSSGSSSCVTNSDGQCTVSKTTKGNTLIFTVGTLSMNTEYELGVNHDHESDSDGNSITINRGEGNDPGGNDPGGNDGGWDCDAKPHPKKCP